MEGRCVMYYYADTVSKLNNDHEYVRDFGLFILAVDKIGGGTLGKAYEGDWTVTWYDVSGNHVEDIPVRTGGLKIHEFVAEFVYQDIVGEW